jgi:hypothetical protein
MRPVIRKLLPPETGVAFNAMQALRTDLVNEQAFTWQVDEIQRAEGYRLVASFEDGETNAHRLYLNSGLVISAHHFAR